MFDLNLNVVLGGVAFVVVIIALSPWLWRRRRHAGDSLRSQLLITSLTEVLISVFLVVAMVIWQSRAIFSEQIGQRYLDMAKSESRQLAQTLLEETDRIQAFIEDSTFYFRNDAVVGDTVVWSDLSETEREQLIEQREAEWSSDSKPAWKTSVTSGVSVVALKGFIQQFPVYTQLLMVNSYGCLRSASGAPSDRYCFRDEPWWIKAWNNGKGNIYVGNVMFTPGQQDASIDIAVPFWLASESTPQGILRCRISLDKLDIFKGQSSLSQAAQLMLVDRNKQVIYNTTSAVVGSSLHNQVGVTVGAGADGWTIGPGAANNQSVLYSYAVVPAVFAEEGNNIQDFDLIFMVSEPLNDALSAVNKLTLIALGGGLLVLLLTMALSWAVAGRIARPIEALTAVSSEVTAGNLNKTAPVSGPLELRTLATAFNALTAQLGQMLASLEQQVQRRTKRLEVAASLGERLSANLDFDTLLEEVVSQIQANFKYYYAHIYLLDDKKEKLVVRAGTGEVGRLMKVGGHSMSLEQTNGLVIRAYHSAQIVWVDDVSRDEGWLPNQLPPDTRSEMAVPIIVEGQVLGVLDVQENRVAGFDEGDVSLLRTLANQVAVAMRNSRLYASVEQALDDAHAAQAQYLDQSWEQSRKIISQGEYHYVGAKASRLDSLFFDPPDPQAETGPEDVAVVKGQVNEVDVEALTAPIKFREQAIGSLQVYSANPDQPWTEDDLLIFNAVVDQLGQAAETLRIFGEAREKVGREQAIREITEKMRNAANIQELVDVVTEQLGNQLSVDYAVLDLGGATAPITIRSNGKHTLA